MSTCEHFYTQMTPGCSWTPLQFKLRGWTENYAVTWEQKPLEAVNISGQGNQIHFLFDSVTQSCQTTTRTTFQIVAWWLSQICCRLWSTSVVLTDHVNSTRCSNMTNKITTAFITKRLGSRQAACNSLINCVQSVPFQENPRNVGFLHPNTAPALKCW